MPLPVVFRMTYGGRNITGKDADRPDFVPIRAWRTIMKAGWMSAGVYWIFNYLPLHFTKAAWYRYPEVYKRRSWSYVERHVKTRGMSKEEKAAAVIRAGLARLPNVHTGSMRQLSQMATARAFQTRVRVTVPVPSYVSSRPRRNAPDQVAELSAVNEQERSYLTQIVERSVGRDLENYVRSKALPVLSG